jgi:hypothetical protein
MDPHAIRRDHALPAGKPALPHVEHTRLDLLAFADTSKSACPCRISTERKRALCRWLKGQRDRAVLDQINAIAPIEMNRDVGPVDGSACDLLRKDDVVGAKASDRARCAEGDAGEAKASFVRSQQRTGSCHGVAALWLSAEPPKLLRRAIARPWNLVVTANP